MAKAEPAQETTPRTQGEAVKLVRTSVGMSQANLAAKVGMSSWKLCMIEGGRISATPQELQRLWEALA